MQWIEWLCHSNFSFLIGASHPGDYVKRAIEYQYSGLGFCDYDGVYGIPRAYRTLKEIKNKFNLSESFPKLIYGSELHLENDHHIPITLQNTIVLFAMNHQGYYELCELLSYSHRHGKKIPSLNLDIFSQFNTGNLICFQPMRGLLRQGKTKEHIHKLLQLKSIFGDRFSCILSYHLNPSEDRWIKPTIDYARKYHLNIILSQDPYFCDHEDKLLSDVIQGMRLNQPVENIMPHLFVNSQRCLLSKEILQKRYQIFPDFKKYLQSSRDFFTMIDFDLNELRYKYPQEMIPDGYSSFTYLKKLTWEGAHTRYGKFVPTKIKDLLLKELILVDKLKFADYFLTVWDIVTWAKNSSILCQGRGSAANSAICFVLGITQADPSLFDLLFERFVSLERGDPPDIDVDFEHERREEVIQYIYRRFGRNRAAMVANVITFKQRGAIRFVGKSLGVPQEVIDKATKLQKMRFYRQQSDHTWDELADSPNLVSDLTMKLWSRLTEKIIGFPRHLGIHSGGFVLTDKPLSWLVAQEPATMSGRTVIQWSKEDIEALGFFKIDILALGMLTALRKSMDLINTHYGKKYTLATIPQEDPDTYKMIQKADTVGTFQIESRAQMSMLPRLRPQTFYDLVIQVGIIRPGPIQGGLIHPYLKRRDGLESIIYPHPDLQPILERTLGIPIFQEQVMRIAMTVGDFSPGEADALRKQIGAWALQKDLGHLVNKLELGLRKNKIEEKYVQQIIGHLQGFADYGFPESHAISFALLAYASSYIKKHYPVAFYAALLNSQPMGFYSRHALIQSAKREGITVEPICVKHSSWLSNLEPINNLHKYSIRLGLHFVRGVKRASAEKMVAIRNKNPWLNLNDFLKRSQLLRSDLTSLAAANAMHIYGLDRRASIWIAEAAPFTCHIDNLEDPPHFPQEDPLVKLQQDFHATSTTLGDHPNTIIKKYYWNYPCSLSSLILASKISNLLPNQLINVFGMVLIRQSPATAKGMVFFTLEDETGFINLVFKPDIYSQYRNTINHHGFICAYGKLQKSPDGHSIMVKKIYTIDTEHATIIDMPPNIKQAFRTIQEGSDNFLETRNYM